jgi:lipoprotein-anchoring transpeptidase ErfK/SrfK
MPMGEPGSIGCVRMRNAEIIELFDLVPAGTPVEIVAG